MRSPLSAAAPRARVSAGTGLAVDVANVAQRKAAASARGGGGCGSGGEGAEGGGVPGWFSVCQGECAVPTDEEEVHIAQLWRCFFMKNELGGAFVRL